MTLRRPIWIAFVVALVAVFAAMGWITAAVLRLDAAEAESRRRAQLEENARLALWRMDSALAPLIAAEHARPLAAFREQTPAGNGPPEKRPASDAALDDGFDVTPPPLPGETASFTKFRFQFEPDGRLTSPRSAGAADLRDPSRLAALVSAERLLASLPPVNENTTVAVNSSRAPSDPPSLPQSPYGTAYGSAGEQPLQQAVLPNAPAAEQQAVRNRQEYAARAQNNTLQYQVQNGYGSGNFESPAKRGPTPATSAAPAVMHAIWCGPASDELVLARRVKAAAGNGEAVQGCWVDWPAVRGWLLKGSADLLPNARLQPVVDPVTEPGDARLLASLPVRLIPGELPSAAVANGSSPLRLSLAIAWACVLLASAAVAGLLRGVVSLSERRGAFVSAVTHELRTPLTTLRMYTEMLEGGMVEDEAQRRHYLGTLRTEADRLGHLVENVLAYSRLERRRDTSSELIESPVGDLLRRPLERLADRAMQAGMTLSVELPEVAAATRVRANPTSLEQVLFNLVDNACKYAGGSTDKTIHLVASRDDEEVRLTLRDHGPGIAAGRASRMFKPFSKSVQEAANSAPGLGLGLALSKRLAAAMGGSLALDPDCRDGARFVLTLPTA